MESIGEVDLFESRKAATRIECDSAFWEHIWWCFMGKGETNVTKFANGEIYRVLRVCGACAA